MSRNCKSAVALAILVSPLSSGCTSAASLQSISGDGVTLLTARTDDVNNLAASERRALQERRLPASKTIVFASIMNVLADSGFRVTTADATTGFVTAIGSGQDRISLGFGGLSRLSDLPTVSIFVEELANDTTGVRAVFANSVASSSAQGSSPERVSNDENTYFQFFVRLEREVGARSLSLPSVLDGDVQSNEIIKSDEHGTSSQPISVENEAEERPAAVSSNRYGPID